MNNFIFNWLIVALISLVLEMTSPGLFFFLSFTIGACAAAVTAWLDFSLTAQVITMLVATLVSFIVLTVWLRRAKYLDATHGYKSNMDALQGKRGLVIKSILPGAPGQVKVAGEIWAARCQHNHEIKIGSWVEVIRVQGAHVLVDKIEHNHNNIKEQS